MYYTFQITTAYFTTIIILLVSLQNLKNQIMTTNLWVEQVRVHISQMNDLLYKYIGPVT